MAEDTRSETNAEYITRTSLTVGELRKQYGEKFAAGYGTEDKLGEVLGRAGVNTLEEYIAQHDAAK